MKSLRKSLILQFSYSIYFLLLSSISINLFNYFKFNFVTNLGFLVIVFQLFVKKQICKYTFSAVFFIGFKVNL